MLVLQEAFERRKVSWSFTEKAIVSASDAGVGRHVEIKPGVTGRAGAFCLEKARAI